MKYERKIKDALAPCARVHFYGFRIKLYFEMGCNMHERI